MHRIAKRGKWKNVNEKNYDAHLHKELTNNIQGILNLLEFCCSRFVVVVSSSGRIEVCLSKWFGSNRSRGGNDDDRRSKHKTSTSQTVYRDKLNAINSVFMQIDYVCERNIRFFSVVEAMVGLLCYLGFHFSRSHGKKDVCSFELSAICLSFDAEMSAHRKGRWKEATLVLHDRHKTRTQTNNPAATAWIEKCFGLKMLHGN